MASDELEQINIEVKKQIRSLVISCPKGLTVRRLLFDYKDLIGEDIPFKKLGFLCIEDYLLTIHDTCRLQGIGSNAIVIPVVTENTKHINDMILKQKPAKTRSKRPALRRSKGVYNDRFTQPPRFQKPKLQNVSNNTFTNNNVIEHNSPKDIQIKTGAIPKQNSNVYRNTERDCNTSAVFTEKVENWNTFLPPPIHHFNQNTQNQYHQQQIHTDTKPHYQNSNNCSKFNEYKTETSSFQQSNNSIDNYNNTSKLSPNLNTMNKPNSCNSIKSDNSNEILQEFDSSDDDLFEYNTEEENELVVYMGNMIMSEPTPLKVETPIHVSRVKPKVKEKLQELISEYPDGIWCSELIRIYEERYKQRLNPLHFGFSSVIQMCDDLPDVFHCIRPNRMDWKLYDKRKPVPDIVLMKDFSQYLTTLSMNNEKEKSTEPAIPIDFVYLTSKFEYPEDVMQPGDAIPRQWITKNMNLNDYIEVIISEVYDPSKFWIQFKGSDTSEALSKVMDDMQLYYMHNAGTLQLNEFSVRIGLFCAALYLNEYHRAVVIKVYDDKTIKVFYIDYGTVAEVALNRTCFLNKEFSFLSMQAVRARLANILPVEPNTMWSREASKLMFDLIREKDLMALVEDIDYEQEILELVITDTTLPDVDIHINDTLIEKGFAILGNKAEFNNSSNAIIPNVHLFPAFEELENGIYPSVSELITMLKLGHTYETIFHGYFSNGTSRSSTPYYNSNSVLSRCNTSLGQSILTISDETHVETKEKEFKTDFITEIEKLEEGENQKSCDSLNNKIENFHFENEISSRENDKITSDESSSESQRSKKRPPPGFEHISPSSDRYRSFQEQSYLCNPANLAGYSLIQHPMVGSQSNSVVNSTFNPFYNNYLIDPVLYNQLLIQKQKEFLVQVQQFQLAGQIQKLNHFLQQSTLTHQNRFSTYNCNSSNAKNMQDFVSGNPVQINKSENLYCVTDGSIIKPDENNTSITNTSEHICDKYVIKIDIKGCTIHILRINDEFYVASQEIISSLLKSKLTWQQWLKIARIDSRTFPNKLINIMNHTDVYKDIQRYSISGVNPPNNLGCNVRVTSINDIIDIVHKFGNKNLIPDLKNVIADVIYNSNTWKTFHSTD